MRPRPLADVTTTPEDPPLFRALERERANLGRDMRYPAELAERQRRRHPGLRPLHSDLSLTQVFELVQAAVLEMRGWEIALSEPARGQIEVTANAGGGAFGIFGVFKQDVVIQVRAQAGGCDVHMRVKSRSRLGGLLGGLSGARRIRSFFGRLRRKLE